MSMEGKSVESAVGCNAAAYGDNIGISDYGIGQFQRDNDLHFQWGHVPVNSDIFDVK